MAGHRKHQRRRGLRITALAVGGALVVAGAGGWYLYNSLDGNIKSVDLSSRIGAEGRPEKLPTGGVNILLLGSDSRGGANQDYGRDDGGSARADTTMLVHLEDGRKAATVVSIPRDTMVARPSCTLADGNATQAVQRAMFNSAYEVGGAACTVKTVEEMSGVRVDHFIEIDFTGFKNVIDAIGGVEVTIDQAIHDDKSHLDLEAGTHTLNGEQALGLVRTRHGVGDGSDLGRIGLQQKFMAALAAKVKDTSLLTDPVKAYKLADTATKSVVTDKDLGSVSELLRLGKSLAGLNQKQTKYVMLPVKPDSRDRNRVVADPGPAEALWGSVRGGAAA